MKKLIKFSSKIDEDVLEELRQFAKETRQPISELLTNAVSEYLQRLRILPMFRKAVDRVLEEDNELLERLVK